MSADRPINPNAPGNEPGRLQAEMNRTHISGHNSSYQDNIGSPMSAFDAEQLLDLTHDAILVMDFDGIIRYWNRGACETFGYTEEEALGRVAGELLQTEFSDSREAIEADVLESGLWDGELVHHNRDGRPVVCASRWIAWEEARTGLPYLLEVSREITARKEAEKLAERERKQLLGVLNVIPGYVAIKDADYRIRFANDGFLEAFGEPGGRPCYEVQYGRSSPCPHCALQDVIEHAHPSQWEACYADGRTYRVWLYPFYMPEGERVALEMGVDITDEKDALRLVADAGETERRQIGRDLHDSIGQKLTALGYLVGGLASRFSELSPEEKSLAEKTVELVKDCITEIRAIARGLNPVDLGEQGLHDALQELARSMEITTEVHCRTNIDPAIELESNRALSVYRIAQEAITNAARHGQAERVWLSLARQDGHVVLSVRDDGVGIAPSAMHPGQCDEGLGLRTMRHRAANMNGRLRVAPHQDGGTLVTCSLPVSE